jgi:hypothetical protein
MCGSDETCGCSLETEEQEAREAAKSRGFKEKMHAPGYACDETCDVDLPDYQRRALVGAGLAPAKATPDELDDHIAATAISRAMGGPYGGPNGLLASALLGKSIIEETPRETPRQRSSQPSGPGWEDFLRDAMEDLSGVNQLTGKPYKAKYRKAALIVTAMAAAGQPSYDAAAREATKAIREMTPEDVERLWTEGEE